MYNFLHQRNKIIVNMFIIIFIIALLGYIVPPILYDIKYIFPWTIILLGVGIYLFLYYRTKDLFHPVAIFSVVLITTVGISNFKLSHIQSDWSAKTWIVIIGTYTSFLMGYLLMKLLQKKMPTPKVMVDEVMESKFLKFMYILFGLCILAYIAELIKSGFHLPIFSKSTGSYKHFGIPFVHYLTVTLAFVNYLISVYFFKYKKINKYLIIIYVVSLVSVFTLLSRQLLIFLIVITIVSCHYMYKKIKLIHISVLLLLGLIIFSILGNIRSNSALYILQVGKIIEGVNSPTFAWVYLYFSMSYENLNYYINHFHDLYYGVNTFFPLFAFTLTKKYVQPDLLQYLPDVNLTVSTMMYDFYLDFGIVGIIIFPFLIGALSYYCYNILRNRFSINSVMFYSMIAHNLFFVFFVNFFANTTWVFHIGVIILFILFTSKDRHVFNRLQKVRKES